MKRLPVLLFAVLLVLLLAALAARSTADPDLWGHIRFGQDALVARSLVVSDPYSFTSDRPWINHEWLAEVIMASAYHLAGVPGLLALPAFAALLSLLLTAGHLSKRGVGEPVIVGLLAVLFAGFSSQLSNIRPQLFSAVMFVVLLVILGRAEERSPKRLLWVIPVFAVWSNLHGGWIAGLGFLGLWALLASARSGIPTSWCILAPLLGLAGTALNPYGWRLWSFLWQTVGLGRHDIDDWQPIFAHPWRLVPWSLAAAVVGIAWRRRSAATIHLFIPVALLGLMGLKVVRLDVSFVAAAVVMLGPILAGIGPKRFQLSRQPGRGDLLIVGSLIGTGLAGALFLASRTAACLPVEGSRIVMPEREALLYAQQNRLVGRMVVWFGYGEYAVWHLAPDVKVSYDGRRETVYSDSVQDAHLRFYRGDTPGYPLELEADYVWIPRWIPPAEQLPAEGWTPIFLGPRSVIFARQAGDYIPVAPVTGPRCFPGP